MKLAQIEARLLALVEESYAVQMDGGDSLDAVLGFDSLELVAFILDLEEEWPLIEDKITFDDEVVSGTVNELAKTIHKVLAYAGSGG
jgi:acyl carrier protein